MAVQVWFAQDEAVARPGETLSVALAIENVGDRTETYTILPAGLTAAWTTVTRPNVTLFAGSRDVIELVVRPPAIHSTSAGPTSLAVRVIPQGEPDEVVVAETIITVDSYDDRRVTMLQPLQRGRRRATFEFMVDNRGNNLANCRLHLVDASGRVDGTFDPPAVGVAPGSSSLVRLRLRAGRGFLRGERQIDFEIEASEPDHEPALGRATLIQPPTIPARSVAKAAGWALAALAVVGAWYGVVRPELRDAADRAVVDRLAEIQADDPEPSGVTTLAPVATTAPPAAGDTDSTTSPGQPTAYRIDVDAGVTQERSESLAIPPDSTFCLTDTVIQNPHGDLGTARLLRNSDVIYDWDLATVAGNQFEPRVTCLPFEPSDNVVLSVACDAVGEASGTGCQVAVLLTGLLAPADLTPDAP